MDLDYFFENYFETIQGAFHLIDAKLFCFFNEMQVQDGITGDIFEIGVHEGKSSALLAHFINSDKEELHVNDIFEQQEYNVSGSGFGCYETFMSNMRRVVGDIGFLRVHKKPSQYLYFNDVPNPVRLFHIDGGHSYSETYSDLSFAYRCTTKDSLIVIDDVFNRFWPGVIEGLMDFINKEQSIQPLLIGINKVFAVKRSAYDLYRDWINSDIFSEFMNAEGINSVKQDWIGREVLIIKSSGKFKYVMRSEKAEYHTKPGEGIKIPVHCTNLSQTKLESSSSMPIFLTYHLLNRKGQTIIWDNIRTPFDRALERGETRVIDLVVEPIAKPGNYFIEIDCVYENVMWFKDAGNQPLRIILNVS